MTGARLIDSLATTDELADLFSDRAVLQAMLDFEIALARAAAEAGAIPPRAAESIAGAARVERFDAAALATAARQAGTPAVAFVAALRAQVQAVDVESASFVHWGATSQDVTDCALVLLLERAHALIARDHDRLVAGLVRLSNAHAGTVMLGRTLLQPATPITFGLKVAHWHAAAARSWTRLSGAWQAALVIQFGGAAGTRAAAGEHAAALVSALSTRLDLHPAAPWHTDRDRLGALVAGLGLYTAALGKIARDIALLMQAEVGEVAEPGGGSSAMPHKRNPSGCAVALAAATRMPGLVAAFLTGMIQEHERALGGVQAEWPTIAASVQTAGAAAAAMAAVLEGLSVDPARMRANLHATRGVVFAERAVTLLTPPLGREAAHAIVTAAVEDARAGGRRFGEALAAVPEAAAALGADGLRDLERPEAYLGESEALRAHLLRAEPRTE